MTRDDGAGDSISPRERQDFRPGHCVHWIQAKKAAEYLQDSQPARIVAVTAHEVLVDLEGQRRHYGVADPNRIQELIERYGAMVVVQESWSILRLRNRLVSIRVQVP